MLKSIRSTLCVFSLAVAAFGLSGCNGSGPKLDSTGPYAGNTVLFESDTTVLAVYQAIDSFETFEMNNRASLPASVTQAADGIRAKAPAAVGAYKAARAAYVAIPSASNQVSLQTTLEALSALAVGLSEYQTATTVK